MSAPNPSMVVFPLTQTASGYREIKIMRVNSWAAGINYYNWDTDHPEDTILLDLTNNSDLLGAISPIHKKYRDEFGRIRLDSRTIEIHDKFIFSGTINGVATGIQDLAGEGKSWAQHYFYDKSDSTTYILWTTIWADTAKTTRLKITFSGDIEKNNMPDQPIIIRNDSNPSNLLRLATITLNCIPIFDRLKKYSARDIGIWNHWQDGNTPLAKSDMVLPSSGKRSPFWGGFKVFWNTLDPNSQLDTFGEWLKFSGGDDPKTIAEVKNTTDFTKLLDNAPGAALFVSRLYGLTTRSVFRDVGGGLTRLFVPEDSFRNGFYPVKLRTFVKKIFDFAGCDTTVISEDSTVAGSWAVFNDTTKQYRIFHFSTDKFFDANAIYNILFGISPYPGYLTTTSASIGSVISVATPGPLPPEGTEVFIEGADDPGANGIWRTTNANGSYFDLAESISTKTTGVLAGTLNKLISTPVTYSPNYTCEQILKELCIQGHYKLVTAINQSGPNIGMTTVSFKSRWASGSAIPSPWTQGAIFHKQPRKQNSDSVKVSQMGDDGYVVCPAKHKLPPLEIPPLRWRGHEWGSSQGIFPTNCTFNGADRRTCFDQESTSYTGDDDNFLLDDDGHIVGSYLSKTRSGDANTSYPAYWANHSQNGLTDVDWDGEVALSALTWRPPSGFHSILPDQYDPKFDLARLLYLELVHNQEIWRRDFVNVALDDIDTDREDQWQVGGVQVMHRMTEYDYDDEVESIPDSTWEESPSNYTDLSAAPSCGFFGGQNNISSSTGANGSSSGTGGGGGTPIIGNYIEKAPLGNNTITPQNDTTFALRKKGHSLTQSANLDENGTWDGTTFTLQSGVGPSGTFFSKKQDAFELLPFGVSASNTGRLKFFELAANGTNYISLQAPDALAANNNYTLPNAYPSAISKALFATTAGVMSWIDINSLFTASGGISLSGTAGVGGVPGTLISINANALSLDRLAQIADQTVLGNISGSTGNVTAVAISSIRGLTYWTESQNTASPNNTVNATRLLVTGGTANNDAVIQPKGTGGFSLDLADSTPTGGNKRGIYSIDLQRYRGGALQVAAGDYSSLLGGRNNTIKPGGTYNVIAGGYQSTIDVVDFAVICGGEVNSVSGIASSVLGGESNAITSAGRSAILGGKSNNINYSGTGSSEACTIIGGYGLSANNNGIFGYLAGDGSKPMTVATANIALFGDVDLWLANNDNAARALKFWAPWNTTGAFPSTNKFAAIKAGVVTTSYTWILPLADSAGYIKSDGSGNLSIDSLSTVLAGAVILVPGSDGRNVIAPASNVYGLTIQQFSFLGKDSLRIKDYLGTVVAAFNGVGANLGDVAGASLGVPLYVRQFTGGGTGAIFEAGTGTPGDIIQVRDASNGILLYVTTDGKLFSTQHIGTSKHIGAGTISPGYALHNLETTNGAEHAREENNAKTNDRLFDEVSTTTNANTVIHNFGMLTGDMVHVWFTIHAKQTAGAGGVIGHKFSCIGEFRAANVGGVAVLLTAPIHTDIVEDTDAETGLWKVTGVVNGSGIDVKVQTPNNNRSVTWKAFFSQKFTVNI